MANKKSIHINQKSILYLLICLGGVIAYILLTILPTQKLLTGMDEDIVNNQEQVEKQKILFPVYQELFKQLQIKDTKLLPFPAETELGRERIGEVPAIFSEIAHRNNLEADVIPDVNTIPRGAGLLKVDARVQGDFFDFRKYLTDLGATPYVRHIEEIQIKPMSEFKEFTVRFWLALAK